MHCKLTEWSVERQLFLNPRCPAPPSSVQSVGQMRLVKIDHTYPVLAVGVELGELGGQLHGLHLTLGLDHVLACSQREGGLWG